MGDKKCTTLGQTSDAVDVLDDMRTKLKGSYPVTKTGLGIGSTATAVANAALDFTISGVRYTKAAVAAGTAPGNDIIPQSTYGAVALDIDAGGTITIAEAAANATGYASAALAIAGIPDVATTKARLGTVTATKSDGAFTFGTTDLDAANTTVVYTDGETAAESISTDTVTI